MLFDFLLYFSLSCYTLASPVSDNHVVHESRKSLPYGWSRHSSPPSDTIITFRIGLTQSNLHQADSFLESVSDASSPQYGQHWTQEQIASTFAPSQQSVDEVTSWLTTNGIPERTIVVTQSKGWVQFQATVAKAEKLLHTEYHLFENEHTGISYLGCEIYSVPAKLHPHIDLITPTLHFDLNHEKPHSPNQRVLSKLKARSPIQKRAVRPIGVHHASINLVQAKIGNNGIACETAITPACLQQLYGFSSLNKKKINKKNSMAVLEMNINSFLNGDLDKFYKTYQPQIPRGWRPQVLGVDGGKAQRNYPGDGGTNFQEATLDLQYSIPFVYPLRVIDFQVGNPYVTSETSLTTFNNFLDAIDGSYCTYDGGDDPDYDESYPTAEYNGTAQCGTFSPPKVLSISYGSDEWGFTARYMQRQCMEYLKLGLQGTTVLYASGDNGVASGNGNICLNAEGTELTDDGKQFVPAFPPNCPYVTTVGATRILPGKSTGDAEAAASRQFEDFTLTSQGGFSNVFSIPSYQKSAVQYYYRHSNPHYTSAQYNNSRQARGFPDISANGQNYACIVGGENQLISGTSASTPLVAALVTMINNERLNAGKSAVGFINPALYANPGVLNDITQGHSLGCGTNGFKAVKGWDPVTGLGTPNYPKMLKLFMSLP